MRKRVGICAALISRTSRSGKSPAADTRIFGEGDDQPRGENVSEARPAKPAILGTIAAR
jgi:hypothetical protein